MAARAKPTAPAPERVKVNAWIFPPPKWKDRAGAIAHLGGDFATQLYTLHDLAQLGADYSTLADALYQLASTADAMAATIARGSVLASDDATGEHFIEIAAAVELAWKKGVRGGFEFKAQDGLGCDLHLDTMPTLARALENAARALAADAEDAWDREMVARAQEIDAHCDKVKSEEAIARLGKRNGREAA